MENCRKKIWKILKIGLTYKKFDVLYIQEITIFNIIVEAPFLIILNLFLVVSNLISYEVFIIILFVLLGYEGCNLYKFFNRQYANKERNFKKEISIDGILILLLFILYITCPIEKSISITAYKIILSLMILHWVINVVLVLIFLKNKSMNLKK